MRSLTAVLAGFLTACVLYQLGAAVAFISLYGIPLGYSGEPPGVAYFTLNLGFSLGAALAGGWITARIARHRPIAHSVALASVAAVFVLWGFSKPGSDWPAWYPPALALVATIGTIAGGFARSRGRSNSNVRTAMRRRG